MVKITVEVPGTEAFFGQSLTDINKSMSNMVERLLKIFKEKAIEHYLSKRKSTNPKSMIVDSFKYELKDTSGNTVVGVVFAGGSRAPYAIYVDESGWMTSTGHREGYQFMLAGLNAAAEAAPSVIEDEMSKI